MEPRAIQNQFLTLVSSLSLKSRILREWQKTTRIRDDDFSEREILTLELIRDYPPITEKSLTKFFGLSFSSVASIVNHLRQLGVIEAAQKARGKPLVLTKAGTARLNELRESSAARYSYLVDKMSTEEIQKLIDLYETMDRNAERHVQKLMFGVDK